MKELTQRQVALLKQMDEHGQLHMVDEELRAAYLSELRAYQILKAGIPITGRCTQDEVDQMIEASQKKGR